MVTEADVAQFTAFKQEIKRRFSHKIAEVNGQGEILIIDLSQPTKIDRLVILEEMAQGEQVLKYSVEGFIDGKQILICEGTSVEPSALCDLRRCQFHNCAGSAEIESRSLEPQFGCLPDAISDGKRVSAIALA